MRVTVEEHQCETYCREDGDEGPCNDRDSPAPAGGEPAAEHSARCRLCTNIWTQPTAAHRERFALPLLAARATPSLSYIPSSRGVSRNHSTLPTWSRDPSIARWRSRHPRCSQSRPPTLGRHIPYLGGIRLREGYGWVRSRTLSSDPTGIRPRTRNLFEAKVHGKPGCRHTYRSGDHGKRGHRCIASHRGGFGRAISCHYHPLEATPLN